MTSEHVAALVSTGIDLAGIAALVVGAALAFLLAGKTLVGTKDAAAAYRGLRRNLGKAILVGLELLVVSDIIRSIAIAPSFASVGVLGIIVVIRTFLSWSLEVEVSGGGHGKGHQRPSDNMRNLTISTRHPLVLSHLRL